MVTYKNLVLDPFQEEAIRLLEEKRSLFVVAPTGSGKTLIAEYALDKAIQEGKRLLYTAPIKALSNQKFRDFSSSYPNQVGILTGDVGINPEAPILIMTTEIFRNAVLEKDQRITQVEYVIFDEAHFMDDSERGTVWEESFIFAPAHIRFLCLSATISNVEPLTQWLSTIRNDPFYVVRHEERSVPLSYHFVASDHGEGFREWTTLESVCQALEKETPPANRWRRGQAHRRPRPSPSDQERNEGKKLPERVLLALKDRDRLPCLYFVFNRNRCEQLARQMSAHSFLTSAEAQRLQGLFLELVERYKLDSNSVKFWQNLLSKGMAFHHAGLLPTVKEIIEHLFTTGLVKVLFATETFALGVNMPARTTVFDSVFKFNGKRFVFLKTREFQQMSGRAGRRGLDAEGFVYLLLDRPQRPAPWQVQRLIQGEPEPVVSKFNLSYATILNLYRELGDRIFEAIEHSFSNFFLPAREGGREYSPHPGSLPQRGEGVSPQHRFHRVAQQLESRLRLLHELGFIDEHHHITARGNLASQLFGYELQVAELVFQNFLSPLSAQELAILFGAMVYEGKTIFPRGRGWIRSHERPIRQVVTRLVQKEEEYGIRPANRLLNFFLAEEVHRWMQGQDFMSLASHAKADPGDLIRFFRQIIQVLRDLAHVLSGEGHLERKLWEAVELLNRDEVDAERQLRAEL